MMLTPYTTQLQAGLGLIEETRILLDLWHEGMNAAHLREAALESGQFPNISARRLRNIVVEGFVPRYLADNGAPAFLLKRLKDRLSSREIEQILFVYTCRANTILADFVTEVYWGAYASGRDMLSNEEAQQFVVRANHEGKTVIPWSVSTVRRVAVYLTGCCADFGLLERGTKSTRKILPYRIEPSVAAILAYDLHFAGHGDNRVVAHPDWALFGMEPADVINELKRLALRGFWIVQHAGGATHIGWQHKSMEEVLHVIAQHQL